MTISRLLLTSHEPYTWCPLVSVSGPDSHPQRISRFGSSGPRPNCATLISAYTHPSFLRPPWSSLLHPQWSALTPSPFQRMLPNTVPYVRLKSVHHLADIRPGNRLGIRRKGICMRRLRQPRNLCFESTQGTRSILAFHQGTNVHRQTQDSRPFREGRSRKIDVHGSAWLGVCCR